MALRKLYYVTCDVCGKPACATDDVQYEAAAARRFAKRRKWTREAGCDICPDCRAKGWRAAEHWGDGDVHRLRRTAVHAVNHECGCTPCRAAVAR